MTIRAKMAAFALIGGCGGREGAGFAALPARLRSAQPRPSAVSATAMLANTKGSRGSTSRNVTARYGEIAPAIP